MQTFFTQAAVRRWLGLGAVALLLRGIAAFADVPPSALLGITLVDTAAATATAIGLGVLLARHLRARGRLAVWEVPGIGSMLLVLALTAPLMRPTVPPPGWLLMLAWLATTVSLCLGALGYVAMRDRTRTEQRVPAPITASPEEE